MNWKPKTRLTYMITIILTMALLLTGCNISASTDDPVTHNTKKIADVLDISEEDARFVAESLQSLGFEAIRSHSFSQVGGSGKMKIKDKNGAVYYIVLENGTATQILDEEEAMVKDLTTEVEALGDASGTVEQENLPAGKDEGAGQQDTGESMLTAYARAEKIDEKTLRFVPTGDLNGQTMVAGVSMDEIADRMDAAYTTYGYNAMNRQLYYDMLSILYYDYESLEAELKEPGLSNIAGYISQMMAENENSLEYGELYYDEEADYSRYTFAITHNIVTLDSNSEMTWNGEPFDYESHVRALQAAMEGNSAPSPETKAGLEQEKVADNRASVQIIQDAGISVLAGSEGNLATKLESYYGCPVVSVEAASIEDMWFIHMEDGSKAQVTSWSGDYPSISVCDASSYDEICEYRFY